MILGGNLVHLNNHCLLKKAGSECAFLKPGKGALMGLRHQGLPHLMYLCCERSFVGNP